MMLSVASILTKEVGRDFETEMEIEIDVEIYVQTAVVAHYPVAIPNAVVSEGLND